MSIDARLAQKFAAVPVHSTQRYSRQGLDPRLARKFLRTSDLLPEERAAIQSYVAQSRWIPEERAVYSAVVDGFSTIPEIKTVTGMSTSRVESAMGKLERKGMLRRVKE